ncbi:hypothetical protein BRCON_1202 [Candidatus Sumerlaea chitinivorans]|uniref:Uncharacterized protein n=1 Tax=Sumerlaea chitinivorans TaxID=2250252 RepID=A0A2Z4Y4R8_SUMC1|nr:hypothetical protein BRCON_1202 [Candidatus Sumerlaea chitinivorans]
MRLSTQPGNFRSYPAQSRCYSQIAELLVVPYRNFMLQFLNFDSRFKA